MKNTIIILSVIGFLFAGCAEDFLTEKPTTTLSSGSIFETENGVRMALFGVYNTTRHDIFFEVPDWLTTDVHHQQYWSDRGGLQAYVMDPNSFTLQEYWERSYLVIARANLLFQGVDQAPIDQAQVDKYKAEALFLRAWKYFDLSRYFGDVPLMLETNMNELHPSRTPVAEIYTKIIADLEIALQHLGERGEDVGDDLYMEGRATKGAVRMLLAKIHLRHATLALRDGGTVDPADYQKCISYCNELINSEYSLLEYYPDVFRNESNEEIIYEVQFEGGQEPGLGHKNHQWKGIQGVGNPITNPVSGAWPEVGGTRYFDWSFFEEGDTIRHQWSVTAREAVRVNGVPEIGPDSNFFLHMTGKWRNIPERTVISAHWDDPRNMVIYRLADVYLMLAEAENELNNGPTAAAIEAINVIRRRACNANVGSVHEDLLPREITNYPDAVPELLQANYDYQTFKDSLLFYERERELFNEGHRYFDLQRWGKLLEAVQASGVPEYWTWVMVAHENVKDHHYLMPIPRTEIDANPNLTQNPGY